MSWGASDRPDGQMGTHRESKHRKFAKAARRRWTTKRKPGDGPSRELRRSWAKHD